MWKYGSLLLVKIHESIWHRLSPSEVSLVSGEGVTNEQTTRGRALGEAMQAPKLLEFLPTLTISIFKCTEKSSCEPEALCHLDSLWCNDLDVMQG